MNTEMKIWLMNADHFIADDALSEYFGKMYELVEAQETTK